PVVTVDSFATNDGMPAVTGTVSELNLDRVEVQINGGPVQIATVDAGNWSLPAMTFADGTYDVFAFAEDRAGNSASASGQVTVDQTPPTVTVDPLESPSNQPTIFGTTDDSSATLTITLETSV